MRSNRLRRYIAVAAIIAGTSSASAQKADETTGDQADNQGDNQADNQGDKKPAPAQVAQAQPEPIPAQPGSEGPTNPGAREPAAMSEDQMRKMIEAEVAKARPRGPALEFAGYARAGVGLNIRGGKQVCFGLAGADAKWRLGNECDYVIEPQFTGRLVQLADNSSWGVVVMPGLYRPYEDPNGEDATFFSNLPAEFRQIYFFGENVPQLLNGRIWGGRRYYDRLQLGINDQFLEIEDSDGAGVEDMQLGVGKLSVAFLMNPNSEASQVANPDVPGGTISTANLAPFKLTARLTGITTMPEGALQVWAAFYGSSTSDDQTDPDVVVPQPDSLFRIGAYHTLGKILGGSNFVGAKAEIGANFLQWRVVVQQTLAFNNGNSGADAIAEFRSKRNRMNEDDEYATENWLAVGARVDHQLAGPFRFLVEAGMDSVFPDTGDALLLVKATGSLAINAGDGPGSRPTFRLFYTHGFWNDAAADSPLGVYNHFQSGRRLNQVYGDATNGGAFGIQAEAWW